MSLRRLRVLVNALPPSSAVGRRARGHHWGEVEYLLADLVDLTALHRVEYVAAHSERTPEAPEPVPRPGVDREAPRKASRDAHDRVMSKMKGGAG